MGDHAELRTLREKRIRDGYPDSEERAQERRENLLAMALAVVVYKRRKDLGLTQVETAERCGLDQAKISRIEGSGAVPTLPLLYRLSKGLDATLRIDIDFADDEPKIILTPHDAAA